MNDLDKYKDHPALKIPCRYCGCTGMCDRPASCLREAARDTMGRGPRLERLRERRDPEGISDNEWDRAWDDQSPGRGS